MRTSGWSCPEEHEHLFCIVTICTSFQSLSRLVFRHTQHLHHVPSTLHRLICRLLSILPIPCPNDLCHALRHTTTHCVHCPYHAIVEIGNNSCTGLGTLLDGLIVGVLLHLLPLLRLLEPLPYISCHLLPKAEEIAHLFGSECEYGCSGVF